MIAWGTVILYFRGMNDLNLHYRQLLGLSDDWKVADVDLDLVASRVTIELEHAGGKLCCPECAADCSRADTAPKRTWRHLDTMQFKDEVTRSGWNVFAFC